MLVSSHKAPGLHSAVWSGSRAASGGYLCKVDIRTTAGVHYTATRKMMLMK